MTINCGGKLIGLDTPKIMGILNLTPDSFYDGGSYADEKAILNQVERMVSEGVNFIDIGGQSTRPQAKYLSAELELERVMPIIQLVLKEFPEALISVDTFHHKVAEQTVKAGAVMINDISAGNLDDKMIKTIGELQVPYVMMHMRGTPKTMQSLTEYDNMLQEILFYFSEKTEEAYKYGVNDIIIDPGFGFSKTIEQNFELIRNIDLFKNLDLPILIGLSRKSTICKALEIKPTEALNGTTVLNTLSLLNGANILRVHDVREARESVELINLYKG